MLMRMSGFPWSTGRPAYPGPGYWLGYFKPDLPIELKRCLDHSWAVVERGAAASPSSVHEWALTQNERSLCSYS